MFTRCGMMNLRKTISNHQWSVNIGNVRCYCNVNKRNSQGALLPSFTFRRYEQKQRGDFVFYYNYVALCNSIEKSPSAVAEEMGFQRSVVTRWRHGTVPRQATLQRIADYFGVTVDDLTSEQDITERFFATSGGDNSMTPAFFHLKKGLEPYNITMDDVDYIVKMFQLHAEKNRKERSSENG